MFVTVEWTRGQYFPYSYQVSVHVVPPQEMMLSGRVSVQLALSYDVSYNVSVVASSLCDQGNATALSILYYGENCHLNSTVILS